MARKRIARRLIVGQLEEGDALFDVLDCGHRAEVLAAGRGAVPEGTRRLCFECPKEKVKGGRR